MLQGLASWVFSQKNDNGPLCTTLLGIFCKTTGEYHHILYTSFLFDGMGSNTGLKVD